MVERERPILFNTEMVRAILDGRKTQTRRLVKNIPLQEPYFEDVDGTPYACDGDGEWHLAVEFSPIQKGDVLYVRETFCGYYLPSPENWPEGHMHYEYRASNPNGNKRPTGPEYDDAWETRPWRPSIHMPKEAARLFLRVTGVRCERLQSITKDEINAEGLDVLGKTLNTSFRMWKELWDSTVRKDAMKRWGWEANPLVWVIEFERIDKVNESKA